MRRHAPESLGRPMNPPNIALLILVGTSSLSPQAPGEEKNKLKVERLGHITACLLMKLPFEADARERGVAPQCFGRSPHPGKIQRCSSTHVSEANQAFPPSLPMRL